MPTLYIPPNFSLIAFKGRNAQQHPCVTTIGAHYLTIPDQTAVNSLSAAVGPAFRGVISNSCSYDGCSVTSALPDGLFQRWDSTSGAGIGGPSGTNLTPQVQYLLRKKTPFTGRDFRGRMYIWGCTESGTNDVGDVAAGVLTDLQSLASTIMAQLNAAIWDDAVLLHSNPATPPTSLVQLVPQAKVATQRRRFVRTP
jgi:hypothetical protein